MAYRALVGFNYPDGKGGEVRVEAGTVLDSLPEEYADDLQDCVEAVEAPAPRKKEGK